MNFLKFKNSKLFFESVNIEKLAKKKKLHSTFILNNN